MFCISLKIIAHRLYSEKDVERLRWIKAKIDEGMQTGQAIRALKRLEEEGLFPEAVPPLLPMARTEGQQTTMAVFHEPLTDALVYNNLGTADQALGEMRAV